MTKFHGRRSVLLLAAPALALLLANYAQAQGARQRTATRRAVAGQPVARAPENLDRYFASCLLLENDNEVQAAKLAQSKAESADVKKFAAQMQKDHEQFIKELERFGGTEILARRNERAEGDREDSGDKPRRPAAGAAAANGNANTAPAAEAVATPRGGASASENFHETFLQIKEELADQCRESVKRELSAKSGVRFDECYIGMQIAAHMKMVDTLIVLERHASPELQKVLREGQETAQEHLDHAKKLIQSLAEGGEKTANRENAKDDVTEEK